MSHVSPITDRPPYAAPGSVSPEANRPGTGYAKMRPGHVQYQSPKDMTGSPYTPITNTPPTGYPTTGHPNGVDGYMHHEAAYGNMPGHRPPHHSPNGPPRPSVQTNVAPYGVLSPVSNYHSQHNNTPQTGPYVQQSNFPPFALPPSDFSNGSPIMQRESGQQYAPTSAADYSDQHQQQTNDVMVLDPMSMPTTIPVFGSDSIMNKSPYVSIPEDFVAYLFNTQDGSPMGQVVPQGYSR